ncbi:hypothetical protein BRADI_4g27200v3 [Brachypodium distachyon]|uniref:Uncharacterized protein n=1 Tax=Brachypodium distachyon TaxID=15368 RepID=I1IP32_BRADI|nr:hypothetical protein BRADI_4g27200v3 [Brachypodium distachyon]
MPEVKGKNKTKTKTPRPGPTRLDSRWFPEQTPKGLSTGEGPFLRLISDEDRELVGIRRFVIEDPSISLPPNGVADEDEGGNSFSVPRKGVEHESIPKPKDGLWQAAKRHRETASIGPLRDQSPKPPDHGALDEKMKRGLQVAVAKRAEVAVRPSPALKAIGAPKTVEEKEPREELLLGRHPDSPNSLGRSERVHPIKWRLYAQRRIVAVRGEDPHDGIRHARAEERLSRMKLAPSLKEFGDQRHREIAQDQAPSAATYEARRLFLEFPRIKDGQNPASWVLDISSHAMEYMIGVDFRNLP